MNKLGAAMNMESEIWLFRTRAGDYRKSLDGSDSSYADALLQERVQAVKDAVLEGADMKTSSFFGMFASPNLHQQHIQNYRPTKASRIAGQCMSMCRSRLSQSTGDDDEEGDGRDVESGLRSTSAGKSAATSARYGDVPAPTDEEGEEFTPPVLELAPAGGTSIDALLTFLGTRFAPKTGAAGGPRDNHYLPVLPVNYATFRIEHALKFYKKRISLASV